MTNHQTILHNRIAAIFVFVFCIFLAGWAWTRVGTAAEERTEVTLFTVIDLASFLFVAFIAVFITYRSQLWTDRVVFAAIAAAFVLSFFRKLSPPGMTLILSIGHALMLSIAACTSLIAVVRPLPGKSATR